MKHLTLSLLLCVFACQSPLSAEVIENPLVSNLGPDPLGQSTVVFANSFVVPTDDFNVTHLGVWLKGAGPHLQFQIYESGSITLNNNQESTGPVGSALATTDVLDDLI